MPPAATPPQAFVESEPVRFLARPGHGREYMRALLNLSRAEQQYEVRHGGFQGMLAGLGGSCRLCFRCLPLVRMAEPSAGR